jgi:hypothetical protein
MAVGTSGMLPCFVIVEPREGAVKSGVDVEEPLAGFVGLDGVVCVPVAG